MIEYKPGKSNEAADALSRAPAYTKEVSEYSDKDDMVLQITVSTLYSYILKKHYYKTYKHNSVRIGK